ncbi:MAG: ORF6N domain-containing protein [Lachnospiraceae bacterium]|nr:ORF6N domain-containing protein [Lachnospiraceae bacterium]
MSIKKNTQGESLAIALIDEQFIRDKIYEVRGVKVMLDFELAEIYGYSTTAFNQQVSNNMEKFEGDDFCFYLTKEEFKNLNNLISKKLISSWGGRRKPPRAFTESGLYMLMTVLRGELATKQSRALIRIFRALKDYISETQSLVTQRDLLRLSMQTTENTEAIRCMQIMLDNQQKLLLEHDDKLVDAFERISDTVKQSDLSPVMLKFNLPEDIQKEFLIREGRPAKADETYIDIYSQAIKTIYIVDNYISIKTLRLLQNVKAGVKVTVFSDNLQNHLHASDDKDFHTEFPTIQVSYITTAGIMHDRFIVLDYGEREERMFHCGASSKDAAVKLTTAITEIMSSDMKVQMHTLIDQIKKNPPLVLR